MCRQCNLMSRGLLSLLRSTGDFFLLVDSSTDLHYCVSWRENAPKVGEKSDSCTFEVISVINGKFRGGKC